ncbi:MAG: 4Fe-4S binding protein [Candidatus Gastranaerophilaceae bacterium]
MLGNKKPYIIRISIAAILFLICITAFIPGGKFASYIYSLNFASAVCALTASFSVAALLIVCIHLFAAWFWGRFYCSTICPFGILQDILGGLFKRKSGKAVNLSVLRYLILAVAAVLIFSGTAVVLRFIDPYSVFGSIISSIVKCKTTPVIIGLIPLFIITALVAWKNRIFCTSICPVGTTLGLCSKIGYNKLEVDTEKCKKCGLCERNCPTGAIDSKEQKIDNERCIRCMRCVGFCSFGAIKYGKSSQKLSFDKSRRTFISSAVITAVAVGILAKGKETVGEIVKKFKKLPICPPGAKSPEEFALKCTSCGLCATQCKGKVIENPNSEYETIHLNYSNGNCQFDCKNCSDICPTGALQKMTLEEKQNCRIAMATFNLEDCIKCGACINTCPKGAIQRNKEGYPEFDASKCIGCGACQNICPMKCISVVAIKKQSKTL